jgi:hypothetical protein
MCWSEVTRNASLWAPAIDGICFPIVAKLALRTRFGFFLAELLLAFHLRAVMVPITRCACLWDAVRWAFLVD